MFIAAALGQCARALNQVKTFVAPTLAGVC